jgi:hypothetical protein
MDDIIKIIDNDMTPRFGHTLTLVCKEKGCEKAVLFGGVTGSDNHYSINSDTYVYYIGTRTWTKLNRKINILKLFYYYSKGNNSNTKSGSCCMFTK